MRDTKERVIFVTSRGGMLPSKFSAQLSSLEEEGSVVLFLLYQQWQCTVVMMIHIMITLTSSQGLLLGQDKPLLSPFPFLCPLGPQQPPTHTHMQGAGIKSRS